MLSHACSSHLNGSDNILLLLILYHLLCSAVSMYLHRSYRDIFCHIGPRAKELINAISFF